MKVRYLWTHGANKEAAVCLPQLSRGAHVRNPLKNARGGAGPGSTLRWEGGCVSPSSPERSQVSGCCVTPSEGGPLKGGASIATP